MAKSSLQLSSAVSSDMENKVEDFEIASKEVDSATGNDETSWQNTKWNQQWGYFNDVAELKSAIIMKAIWCVGKGYTTDPATEVLLDHISGWGKDSFDDILFNMEICKRIGGDAYAEIIRDPDSGTIINIKPLDPGKIKIIVDKKGIIKRYEQSTSTPNAVIKFQPEDILHLSNNRLADQIHGISDIDAVEKIILADAENFNDAKIIMHHQARPMIMFKLGTDDTTTINAFANKMDLALNKGENIYIPDDENSVSYEVVQVNVSPLLLPWRDELKSKFYRAVGLPVVLFGSAGATESGSKVEYMAHEQIFEHQQRQLEKQLWNQLQIKIDLVPPASMQPDLQADQGKDVMTGVQPSDTNAARGR
jgi:hypothetical protein